MREIIQELTNDVQILKIQDKNIKVNLHFTFHSFRELKKKIYFREVPLICMWA